MNIQKINCNQNVNFGKWAKHDDSGDFPPQYVKDGGKDFLDGLHKAGEGLRAMIHKPSSYSSAPNVSNAVDTIVSEEQRLTSRGVETYEELEEKGYKPKVDSDGIVRTCGIPYERVMQLEDGTLVEYKEGKPVTIIKNISNGDKIEQKIVKYEYPEGSIAALRTETSVIQETNYKKGQISYKVPPAIQKEVGLI